MSTTTFLASLPAILGITGFAIYQLLGRSRRGDEITRTIVDKLRERSPREFGTLPDKLTPKELAARIAEDQRLRATVDDQDFQLLRSALSQQFVLSLVVYLLCGLLFAVGAMVFAYVTLRPTPVALSSVSLTDVSKEAAGLPVDLDELRATWASSGEPEDVRVYLENTETGRRSSEVTVRSSDGSATMTQAQYQPVLSDRRHLGKNTVRVVVQTGREAFFSKATDVFVGTKISVVGFPEKVKIMGRIDNEPIAGYDFEAKVLFYLRHPAEPTTLGGFIRYGQNDFPLPFPDRIDWATLRLYYMGPDDYRIVRPEYVGLADISQGNR